MQYNQPPQYVTHRAQQELIKEFFQPVHQPQTGQQPGQHQNDVQRSSSNSNQKNTQFFQSQRVLSSDSGSRGTSTQNHAGNQMLLGSYQPLIEPQSAKIPNSGGTLNNFAMNSNTNYVLSARGQNIGQHKSYQSNERNNESDHGGFQQALGFLQNVCSKNSMASEQMSARQQRFKGDHVSPPMAVVSSNSNQRPIQKQSTRQMSNHSNQQQQQQQYESQNSRHPNREISRVDSNSNIFNGIDNNNNSYTADNSFQTGKDFADMVSIEAANCLKQKQSSCSISRPQQQNYKTAYSKLSTSLVNGQISSTQNQIEIQTAIKDSKNLSNFSNDQSKSDSTVQDPINFANITADHQNALSKSMNYQQRASGATSSKQIRDSQVVAVESSRIVPQMYMKQLCSGLNTSAVSSSQQQQQSAITTPNGRTSKQIQNSARDKNQCQQINNTINGQKFPKQQQPPPHLQQQEAAASNGPNTKIQLPQQKQAKSSERVQTRQKAQAHNYSPFQNRLYHQYQSSVPANQTYNGNGLIQQINSNVPNSTADSALYQRNNQFNRTLELTKSTKQPSSSSHNFKNNGGAVYSKDGSRESSLQTKHVYQQQLSSSHPGKSNLQNPKVIHQQRQDMQLSYQNSNSQLHSHALMSSTGALAKSQGDRVIESNNQTIIHDSINQESTTQVEKMRHKSATYMRGNTDAYDNLNLTVTTDYNSKHNFKNSNQQDRQQQNNGQSNTDSHGVVNCDHPGFTNFYNQFKESHNSRQAQKVGQLLGEQSQTIDYHEAANYKKGQIDNERGVFSTLSINKSACTTARGPGPTVASGPLNPIGQKQQMVYTTNHDQMRMSSSNQRPSQMRQSACGLAQKVMKTSSRKSLGFQSNVTSLANSRKQLETVKTASLRGGNITVDDKNSSFTKAHGPKTSKQQQASQNVRNSAVNYKSPLIQTNQFGTQRSKHAQQYSANQNEQSYPRVSPKSTSSLNKSIVDSKVKRLGQSSGGCTTASQARATRYTPTKTDQARKSNVSPFKTTPNQGVQNTKTMEGYGINNEADSSCKQTSPDQSSIITADLKYLYERQKKMVAQLSQNKIGSSIQQTRQQVPGLTLETINERMPVTATSPVNWSQTPKQSQNFFTPSSNSYIQNIPGQVVSKTMRGNPPSSYHSFINSTQQPKQQKDVNYQINNQFDYQKQNNNNHSSSAVSKQQPQSTTYTSLLASKILGMGETRQSQQSNNNATVLRQSQGATGGGGVSAVTTHRDFIQENKKVCSQAFDKMQTIQVGQQRGAQSQGKTTTSKPLSKEKHRTTDQRATGYANDRVTPKKLIDKKDLVMQKQKTRNDMNKTQYLSKKSSGGTNQSKKGQVPASLYNNVLGSMVKSPSYRGLMATQMVESSSKSNLIDNLLNNKGIKQQQRTTNEQYNKQNQQLMLKNKAAKQVSGLNMTINISSSNRPDTNSMVNTYRASTKSQQRYLQTQPEDQNDSKLNQKSQIMKGQDITEYLRTVQTSQGQHDNTEMYTFAQNNGTHINLQAAEIRNPTFQQQISSANQPQSNRSSEKVLNGGQIQITECSRDQIFASKTNNKAFSGSAFKPNAQNSNGSQREMAGTQKQSARRDEIANILIQSRHSKNYPASVSSKGGGAYNNSKLGQKNTNSSPTKKNEAIVSPVEMNNNIVSFQQIQEKSGDKSQENRSPLKKQVQQKEDKENLNIILRPLDQKVALAQAKFADLALNQTEKRGVSNTKQIEMAAIETQNEEPENKHNDYKLPQKTNKQSNIQQYLQAQKQERPVFAPQNQNQTPLKTKGDGGQNQTATGGAGNQNAQPQQIQNVNDTMCFSQKMSLDEYVIGKQIGQGAYAVVRIGLHKPTNKKVALKIYKKYKLEEPNRRKSVKREIKLMEKMKHISIVQLFEIIDTQKYVILIMEYVGGGSLHGYLKSKPKRRLEEWDAKRIFKQIIEGLKYCHSRCITHRDIKLENLLLDENSKLKIIDFGFSTCIPNDKKIKIFCGTPSYMAPEIVMKTEYCGPPADIWAMGVLLFTILSGQFPYRGATDEELYDKICRADYHLPKEVKDSLSPAAKDLISKLFSLTAEDRPTARQILEHQWLYNVETKDHQQPLEKHNDSVTQIQSSECLQLQKRAKSQRLDCMNAPKNKTSETANPVERRVAAVNPFNMLNHNTQGAIDQQHQQAENKRTLNKIGQQVARSSSHAPGKSQQSINSKVIEIISAKLGYDPHDVEHQVRKDLLLSENKDQNCQYNTKNQTSFVGNLYLRLLDEEEDQKQIRVGGGANHQFKDQQQQRAKSDISTSEQQNIYLGSDAKSQQKSDNGYHSSNIFNQTQHLLMKSAISQTSLGMSGTGGNMTSQGFGQGNGVQNLAIQPSFVPSMKSLNSGSGNVNLGNTTSLTHLNFNNTLTTPINFNNTVQQPNNHSPLNFNNTQPLKGILDTLNDTTTTYSAAQQPQILSTPSTHRDQLPSGQQLPLNFTQTNIFVTNNNQVYGSGVSSTQNTEKIIMDGGHQRTASNGTTQDENTEPHFSVVMPQSSRTVQAQKRMSKTTTGGTRDHRQATMLVNNFFTEGGKTSGEKNSNSQQQQQESPNFRQRGDPEAAYCTQA